MKKEDPKRAPTSAAPTDIDLRVKNLLADAGVHSVLACISGGADSVALLLALKGGGFDIHGVHCNFHLRGEESDRDQRFVEALCGRIGVPLTVIDIDVKAYTRTHNASVEMACRELRYDEFRRLHRLFGTDRIAVAHNADDVAETLLLNLMRGSGVAGLRSIMPDTGEIIRPLAGVPRADILRYLHGKGETFVTDSTNLSSDYRRNFLRNDVIPLLETRWPEAKRSICRTAEIMRQEEKMLAWAERQFSGEDDTRLKFEDIRRCPDPLWLVTRFAGRFGCKAPVAREIIRTLDSPGLTSGRHWSARDGRITLERDRIEYIKDTDLSKNAEIECSPYPSTPEILAAIRQAPLDELWTTLPPDRIRFRGAEKGDRIKPLGMKGSMLVSKIFKDAKLSQAQKEGVTVAEDAGTGETIWVEGLKRSRLFLADETCGTLFKYCRKT